MTVFSMLSDAQTFIGTGGPIADFTGVAIPQYYPCVVSGLPTSIDSVIFGLETVCIDITHSYDKDMLRRSQVILIRMETLHCTIMEGIRTEPGS